MDVHAVVASMSVASRSLISQPVLGRHEMQNAASRTRKRLEDLELEVKCGKCHLRWEPTSGTVVRIVQVVVLKLQPDGAIFAGGGIAEVRCHSGNVAASGLEDARRRDAQRHAVPDHGPGYAILSPAGCITTT